MNIVFIMGKIVSKIEYKFILESRNHIAIAIFTIELSNKSEVQVKAYNELVDKCYQELKISQIIVIEGRLNSKGEIEGIRFEKNLDSYYRD